MLKDLPRTAVLSATFIRSELLALCLKKIKGLKSLSRIVDCRWLFTEPHSNKLALRITAQADVLEGSAVAEQSFNIQGLIHHMQCDDCKKVSWRWLSCFAEEPFRSGGVSASVWEETEGEAVCLAKAFTPHAGWTAMVQVRQRTEHKRTFLFLEQLVLQQQPILQKLLSVVQRKDGLDFHFPNRQTAAAFSAFCSSRFPCKTRSSKQLISHDASSNTYFYKYTICVELAPVCKDDLVFIPGKKSKEAFGGFSSISLCSRVACGVQFVDPFTARELEVSADVYFRDPIQAVCTRKHLSHFLVLSVSPLSSADQQLQQQQHKLKKKGRKAAKAKGAADAAENSRAADETPEETSPASREAVGKFRLADLELMRCTAEGAVAEGQVLSTRTHLGAVLQSGDFVCGYDVAKINLSGFVDSAVETDVLWPSCRRSTSSAGAEAGLRGAPFDVVVVKKFFPFRKPGRRRPWVLRSLQKERAEGETGEESSRELERRKRTGGDRRMEVEADEAEQFKRDLEEDPELRRQVALFRDPRLEARNRVGAAGVTGLATARGEKSQKKNKRSMQTTKARRLASHPPQTGPSRKNQAPEAGKRATANADEAQESGTEDADWTSSEEEDPSAPQVDLSELLEGLTLEDLKPVTPGQGVTEADREELLGEDEREDRL